MSAATSHGLRPIWLLLAALLLISAGGAVALSQPACAPISDEQFRWFWGRHYWQAAFDALSATCGVGMLTRAGEAGYTQTGRWVLLLLGQLGAAAYLWAALALWRVGLDQSARVSIAAVLGAFAAWQLALTGLVWSLGSAICPTVSFGQTALLVGSAFCGLGSLSAAPPDAGTALMLAFVGLFSVAGWPLWLLGTSAPARHALLRVLLPGVAVYAGVMALAALLLWTLEGPRGALLTGRGGGELAGSEQVVVPLSEDRGAGRAVRCAVLVVNATSTGVMSEPIADVDLRDSSRMLLALLVLGGGLGGGPAGGVKWLLLASLLLPRRELQEPRGSADAPQAFAGAPPQRAARGETGRGTRGQALAVMTVMGAMALGTCGGLLLLEQITAARYQPAPSFADAFLDASAAVGGANLTTGVAQTVISPNLTAGIRLPVNLFELGMAWLMVAMLAGRVAPLLVLAWTTPRGDARPLA